MRLLLMLAAVAGLAMARPELYREKEDFQFSRSSTDEGTKSGFYGAQRGNMGGNYERAHNMDPLAQNQMSGLVRTVEGELGSGSKQQAGSVYSSANSRGVYGSGNYDLSNLEGRNFQESVSYGADSQSQSSSSRHSSATYRGQNTGSSKIQGYGSSQGYNADSEHSQSHDSRYRGYNAAGSSDQVLYTNSHQRSDNLQSASQYDTKDRNTGYTAVDSGYYSQAAGYQQGQVYDQGSSHDHTSNGYGSNINTRLVNGTPVRIVIRPGTKVVVPVAAQTYNADQSSTASFDQNAINSKTEVINGNDQHILSQPKVKHYESSYSYRKEWEKKNTKPVVGAVPLAIPTLNPYPVNSELYEDAQVQMLNQQQQSSSGTASQSHHSSHSGYNVHSASSSQTRQAAHSAQQHSSDTGSTANRGAYNGGSVGVYNGDATGAYTSGASGTYNGNLNLNQVEDTNTKPKGYQSSYSYHKSWERQGDPYIIKPSTNGLYEGQDSSRLTAASSNTGAYSNSNHYGTHRHQQSRQSYASNSNIDCDCDENGHIRVARSYNTRGDVIGQEELGQQTQNKWDKMEDLSQQTQSKWDNLENQQIQPKWDKIEDLGQQTQQKWDKIEDLSQQTQQKWDKIEDLGQQTQQKLDKIEDLGQQTQNSWDKIGHDFGQQTQNTWEPQSQTDLGQQTEGDLILEVASSGMVSKPSEHKPSATSRQQHHGVNFNHQSDENTFIIAQTPNHQTQETETYALDGGIHHHTIWDEIQNKEIGQENEDSFESDTTQGGDLSKQTINMNVYTDQPWLHDSVDKVQVDVTNPEPNRHNIFDMPTPNPHPWMYHQIHHHNTANSNQYFAHSSSSSFSGSQSHSWREHSTNMNSNKFNLNEQTHSSGSTSGSSIMGLWDKLDNIEKDTIPSHGDDDESTSVMKNDQHSILNNAFESHVQRDAHEIHPFINPTPPNRVILANTSTEPTSTTEANKDKKIRPQDIGRGDIEPENEEIERELDSKPNKTQEQIETLSLTKEIGKTESLDETKKDERDYSVMSLDQQTLDHKHTVELGKHNGDSVTVPTTNTQTINYHDMHNNINLHHDHDTNEEKESRGMEQQFEDQGQVNLDQQTLVHQFADDQVSQHHNNDQIIDFGQQSENIGTEQMEQNSEIQNIGQSENFHQDNKKHEAEDFGQQSEQFDQISLSGWKPDENFNQQEHKLTNWGQENKNLDQQSQSGWAENVDEQQVQTVWKPQENLQQQSKVTETFEPPSEDLSQQVQPAWKPTEDFQQHSQITEDLTPQMENLNQQVQTVWVPEDVQQQNQLIETFSQPMEQKQDETSGQKQSEVVEEVIVPKKVAAVGSPPEVEVTEKPGFWKSVGNKFTNAKDKVASWFTS